MRKLTTALLSLLLIPAIGIAQEVSKSGNNWYVINSSPSGKLTIGTSGAQPVELIVNQAGTSPKGFRVNGTTGNLEGISGTEGISVPGSGLFADGTAGAPSISFSSDADTGFYRSGTNTIGMSTGGVVRLTLNSGGSIDMYTSTAQIRGGAATVGAPSFSFFTDPNTGIYSVGADQIGVSAGGALVATFDSGGMALADLGLIKTATVDGADNAFIGITPASASGTNGSRGAECRWAGNEDTNGGYMVCESGAVSTALFHFDLNHSSATFNVRNSSNINIVSINSGGLDVTGEVSISGAATSTGVLCTKADGDIGQCTSAVGAGGTCTCA